MTTWFSKIRKPSSNLSLRTSNSNHKMSVEVEEGLSRVALTNSNTISMLLLGTGGCGKSTILKQLEMIHSPNGVSNEKLRDSVSHVHYCILEDIHNLCSQNIILISSGEHPECKLKNELNERLCYNIAKQTKHRFMDNCMYRINEQIGTDIQQLWNDSGIKNTFIICEKSAVMDNTAYFFNEISRICSSEYQMSTFADYVKARIRTTGIIEFTFPLKVVPDLENKSDGEKSENEDETPIFRNRFSSKTKKKKNYENKIYSNLKITDVGGQRVERRKWMQCFTEVDVLLYVMSLADYDKVLWEDRVSNCMQEAFDVFEKLMNEKDLKNVDVIVILNKLDSFQEKISVAPFELFVDPSMSYKNITKNGSFIWPEINNNHSNNQYNRVSQQSQELLLSRVSLTPVTRNTGTYSCLPFMTTPLLPSLNTLKDVEQYVIYQLKKRFQASSGTNIFSVAENSPNVKGKEKGRREFLSYYVTCALDMVSIEIVFSEILDVMAKSEFQRRKRKRMLEEECMKQKKRKLSKTAKFVKTLKEKTKKGLKLQ